MASAQPCRAAADRMAGWAGTAEHVGRAGVIDDWQGDRICVGRFVAGSVPVRGHLASLALYFAARLSEAFASEGGSGLLGGFKGMRVDS